MKYFKQLAAGININPLANAIARKPELWNVNDLRTTHQGSAHVEADDIWLRFKNLDKQYANAWDLVDDAEVVNYQPWFQLPQAHPIIFDLMRAVEATRLGSVIVTRLRPGSQIHPHTDDGRAANYYQRYHVAIQSLPGALFNIGDETVNFQTGDIWMIDNQVMHSVVNNSADDRIVMIVDIRSE